ncbi:alpha-amylase family glycosyl hydrolase [Solimonas marina]|uniref:Alpha-glucosidase n=1 Tax=Solimonas marina TaxID=2714601 RepID=A0A969WBZ7_9GAMM|nr:alpha-amylase family glycosyl hydrolase [Solimonas marina]NKF24392.1 alpha-glucosidase [Solimonas marina]
MTLPRVGPAAMSSARRAAPEFQTKWWRDAIIYQIGVAGFQDSDGDGFGDLAGVVERLDYIESLGVDAIWLTPFYISPFDDYGYDITDHVDVDSRFGSLAEFDRLVELVHQRGLKLILDMVWNHTSDQHPWFRDSAASREGRYADWYVWADPAPGGGPPNNWRSAFTGDSGWKYVDARKQYYFFNFLHTQPDLNWHNPDVRRMVLDCAKFWLNRGIDGMRLDAVNFYTHDPQLRDDPVRKKGAPMPDGMDPENPAAQHCFVNSFCREETLQYLEPLRALVDQYPGVMMLGEVTLCEDTLQQAAQYVRGQHRLHLAYHSALHFHEPTSAARLRAILEKALRNYGPHGICWIVGNHDYGRTRSYWGGRDGPLPEAFYHMIAALLVTLPGAFCLWQGDELGLPDARIPEDIPKSRLQDPFGKLMYPKIKGRDGSRTPMPWRDDQRLCGFSSADDSWLPIPDSHRKRAVSRQEPDPGSLLNRWRKLLHWRRTQAALNGGETRVIELDDDAVLGFERHSPQQALLCLFNQTGREVSVDLSRYARPRGAQGIEHGFEIDPVSERLLLRPWGTAFAEIDAQPA